MSFNQPPHAGNELLQWARKNRPDMVHYLEEIINTRGERGDAFILLIAAAFSAGRWYQHQNPQVDNLISQNPYEV